MNKHVGYVEIDSDYGHDTLIDSVETKVVIKSFWRVYEIVSSIVFNQLTKAARP